MENVRRYAEPVAQIPRRFDAVSEGVKRDSSGSPKISFDKVEDINERLLALEKRVEALERICNGTPVDEYVHEDAVSRMQRMMISKNFQ